MIVARRPTTDEEARALALKVYAFCSDTLQDVEYLNVLAAYLKDSTIWALWWD